MIRIEIVRYNKELKKTIPYIDIIQSNVYDRVSKKEHYDTMIRGNKICGIMIALKSGEGKRLKLPKLIEMYKILFQKTPKNLHNSMVDVLVTMRCYLKLSNTHRDIDDTYFELLIQKILNNQDIKGHLNEFNI